MCERCRDRGWLFDPENRSARKCPDCQPPPDPEASYFEFPGYTRARGNDPGTSFQAAESLSDLRDSQRKVYEAMKEFGPVADHELVSMLRGEGCGQSVSGIRTRRSELVILGLVMATEERRTTPAGRRAVVWKVR